MGEERRARGPLLIAVGLHGVDIGAVEQRLVGIRLIAQHALDQLILAGHGTTLVSALTAARAGIQ